MERRQVEDGVPLASCSLSPLPGSGPWTPGTPHHHLEEWTLREAIQKSRKTGCGRNTAEGARDLTVWQAQVSASRAIFFIGQTGQ